MPESARRRSGKKRSRERWRGRTAFCPAGLASRRPSSPSPGSATCSTKCWSRRAGTTLRRSGGRWTSPCCVPNRRGRHHCLRRSRSACSACCERWLAPALSSSRSTTSSGSTGRLRARSSSSYGGYEGKRSLSCSRVEGWRRRHLSGSIAPLRTIPCVGCRSGLRAERRSSGSSSSGWVSRSEHRRYGRSRRLRAATLTLRSSWRAAWRPARFRLAPASRCLFPGACGRCSASGWQTSTGRHADVALSLDQAARSVRARGAPGDAAELYEEAWRLTPPLETDDAARRAVDAAECHFEGGDFGRVRALLEEVTETQSSERARALAFLGWVRAHQEGFGVGVDIFRAALEAVGPDIPQRIEVERGLAWSLHNLGDLHAAEIHSRAALEMAERLREPSVLARALANMAFH